MRSAATAMRRAHQFLLYLGCALTAALLFKFALDFSGLAYALALPLWVLAAVTVAAAARGVVGRLREGAGTFAREGGLVALLLAAVPLGFLASSLDCTGLDVRGCGAFCTFVKIVWVPLLAFVCLLYYVSRREAYLFALTLMSFVPLVPHCICHNPANGWWIDRFGASPQCYLWGFAVSLLAVPALAAARERAWTAAAVSYTIIAGALSFFVGHHYFGFPW